MAASSDEIIKRQVLDEVGSRVGNIKIRLFPESSNEDQVPFSEGGLTFGYEGVNYGSCDAAWYIPDKEYVDGMNGEISKDMPVVALEGTDALMRGSSGNAQYQRFHHALGAVKNGLIGIYYLRKGTKEVQPDLYGMAYNATKTEKGYYLITQDLKEVKSLLELIDQYGVVSKEVEDFLNKILDGMYKIYKKAFDEKYNSKWEEFADKRSTILLNEEVLVKHAGRCYNNFTKSSQRAGHIAVGEMYLTKYFFPQYQIFYLFPRMTNEEKELLDKTKKTDKEWALLRNESNVFIKTMDDLVGLPHKLRQELLYLRDKPLKKENIKSYRIIVREVIKEIKSGKIKFK